MAIHWRKEMAVDDAIIDDDHKHLIAIINGFEETLGQKVTGKVLEQGLTHLKHYTLEHFRREEELQRAAQYSFADAHYREHRDLIKKLDTIIAHQKVAASRSDVAVVAQEIASLLKEWLVQHIIQSDLRMRPYVAKMKAHRQTMAPLR